MGQSDLDELLAHRDKVNERLRKIIDEHTEPWGVEASFVEVKDVFLPENLQRSMARQAEAEREKRAKIIHAEGEREASKALVDAAETLEKSPTSIQLRYMQTLVEMASEQNATVLPIPMGLFTDFINAIK